MGYSIENIKYLAQNYNGINPNFFKVSVLFSNIFKNTIFFKQSSVFLNFKETSGNLPLSTIKQIYTANKNFIKLYDTGAFKKTHFYMSTRFGDFVKNVNKGAKIKHTRNRAILVTRFMKHGKKERSLRIYAKSLAYYRSLFKEITPLDLVSYNLNFVYNFIQNINLHGVITNSNISKILMHSYAKTTFYNLPQINNTLLFNTDLFFPENSEFLIFTILLSTPIESFIITKVPKVVYKNTRGKSGKIIARVVKINRSSALPYSLKNIRYSFNASKQRGFLNKYIEAMYYMLIAPEQSITGQLYKKVTDAKKL